VDAGLEEGQPDSYPQNDVDDGGADGNPLQGDDAAEQAPGHHHGLPLDAARIEQSDDDDGADVVDDGQRQEEELETGGQPSPGDRQHTEGKSYVGGHGNPPTARGIGPRVESQVEKGRNDHPARGGHDRERGGPSLPQLARYDLALDLQPNDEKEHRHQPLVDPRSKIVGEVPAAEPEGELHMPERFVRDPPGGVSPN
jgi:hypothetical protein